MIFPYEDYFPVMVKISTLNKKKIAFYSVMVIDI